MSAQLSSRNKGISRDKYGFRCYVKVGLQQREKRFTFETPIREMQRWRDEVRVALRVAQPASQRGTLAADTEKYLERETVKRLASYKSRRSELKQWCALYGTWPRARVARAHVIDARETWLAAGVAPKTINHRVETLRRLFVELDGPQCPTPCDHIKRLPVPKTLPQFVTVSTIRRVAKKLSGVDQARFMVLTATGQRPAQLKRAQPGDVNLRRRVWLVRPAKGGHPIPVFLNDDMVAAWKRLLPFAQDGDEPFGFDTSTYDKKLYAAGWPKDVRPYNAKHTVGLALAESGLGWDDIRDYFGHADSTMTKVYTGIVAKRLKHASEKLADRKLGFGKIAG